MGREENDVIQKFKGRGAVTNTHSSRCNMPARKIDGDWLDMQGQLGESETRIRTEVTTEFPKSIISFNKSPDIPFDRSINAYRGCEHGCIYCFARPTHAYHDLSPGLDFETRLFAKPDAARLLRETLAKPNYRPAPLAIGTNTDPYQPIERDYRITGAILEVMLDCRHPVMITTKSDRVLADIDVLSELARQGLTAVAISVTTLDPKVARLLEPRAPSARKRLDAVAQLSASGIPTHVNIAPIIPAITDSELENIARLAAERGACSISAIPLRLPHEVAPLFEDWLAAHYPDRRHKVMRIVREMRGGKRNDPRFIARMRGQGPWAELLRIRLSIARKKYGLNKGGPELRTDLFRRPTADRNQLELF